MTKTRFCDMCQHAEWHYNMETHWLTCAMGHKPRFYKPKSESPHETNWGYKRRCDDYKEEPAP